MASVRPYKAVDLTLKKNVSKLWERHEVLKLLYRGFHEDYTAFSPRIILCSVASPVEVS